MAGTDAVGVDRKTIEKPGLAHVWELLPALAVFFIGSVWIPAAVVAVLLLAKVAPIWLPAQILTAVLIALMYGWLFRGLPHQARRQLAAIIFGLTMVAAVLSMSFYDTATDGRWYHSDAILALLHGINPIYAQIPAVQPVWANHYPKATWYFAALVIHTFGSYQLGKIYHFLLIFACAAYAVDFFQLQGLNSRYSRVLAFSAALSPVAAAQMMTYYVDGALGSLIALTVMATVNIIFHTRRLDRTLFVLSASLAIAIKFTAIPYVGVIVCVLLVARVLLRWRDKAPTWRNSLVADSASVMAALSIGIVVLGFNPYITNIKQGLHPMYPVLGKNKIDIITPTAPVLFVSNGYSPARKFLISFFAPTQTHADCQTVSSTGQNMGIVNCHESLKIPFSVRKQELINLGTPDTVLSAWGVFFSGVTLGSLVLFVIGSGWRDQGSVVSALLLVAMTSFINPECWWARYVPQLSLIPVFLLVSPLRAQKGRLRIVAQALCVFLVLNCLLSAGGAMGASFVKSRKLEQTFAAIARTAGTGEYWAYRNPERPGAAWFNSYPESKVHYEQFSGHQNIVICDELNSPAASLPRGGFPVGLNMRNATEVTLYKGRCSAGPPF